MYLSCGGTDFILSINSRISRSDEKTIKKKNKKVVKIKFIIKNFKKKEIKK